MSSLSEQEEIRRNKLKELKKNNLIIALGGGAFINESIRREVKSSCLSFWLDLKVKSLLIRLKNVKKC